MKYYLLALYKTIKTGQTHYWKQDLLGCTTELKEAGLFEVREAIKLKVEYFHGRAVLIKEETGKNLLVCKQNLNQGGVRRVNSSVV